MSVDDFYILGFYGLGGPVWSQGINHMLEKAADHGFRAEVFHHAAAPITGFAKAKSWSGRIIIIGHSMGATAAVDLAEKLVEAGRQVDLLITLDCHRKRDQISGVIKHIDIHQDGRIFGVKPLYPVARNPKANGKLVSLKAKERHDKLDNANWVHELFLEEITALAKPSDQSSPSNTQNLTLAEDVDQAVEFLKVFFKQARSKVFGGSLTQEQVRGMKSTLALWFERHSDEPIQFLIYILATTFHETDKRMVAIREYGSQERFTRLYDITGERPDKARRLGNLHPGDGALFCGRGKPQLTGRNNYQKATLEIGLEFGVDFETEPDKVLEDKYSDLIMFSGMLEGWFTGKSLRDYFKNGSLDTFNARRTVNGTDKAGLIKQIYNRFAPCVLQALEAVQLAEAEELEQAIDTVEVSANKPLSKDTEIELLPKRSHFASLTNFELVQLINEASAELAGRATGHPAPVKPLLPKQKNQTQTQGTNLMNPLRAVDGYKTYLSLALMAGVAIAEGLLGFDIPGVAMQDNWAEVVLGTGAAGGFRSAAGKLIRALRGEA